MPILIGNAERQDLRHVGDRFASAGSSRWRRRGGSIAPLSNSAWSPALTGFFFDADLAAKVDAQLVGRFPRLRKVVDTDEIPPTRMSTRSNSA